MKRLILTKLFLALTLALMVGFGLAYGHLAWAQSTEVAANLEEVGTTAGLSAQDPTIIVAKIIRAGLSVLGIIALVILMYGGFLWMTAGGNEDKVGRAKRLITNAAIGLVIILFSVGITQFVLQSLLDATGSGSGGAGSDGSDGGGLGGGSSSAFEITKHVPTGVVSIRNVVPQITFSKNLDATTVTPESITFTYADGAEIAGTLTVTGNRVSFTPNTPCPAPDADRFCFNESAVVNVVVATDILSSTGTVLSCVNGLCTSTFTTGTLIDTEDPVVNVELPDDGDGVPSDSLVDVQVSATDDAQVAAADFLASDIIFDSVPASGPDLTNVLITTLWDTTGLSLGSSYELTATVMDIAGNTDSDSVTVEIRAITCFDGLVSGSETGPDCGGDPASPDYCGACDGSSCTDDGECSSGFCEGGICVALPVIDSVTPAGGAPGTWVSIAGSDFGNATGSVIFTGISGPVVADFAPCADSWSDDLIIVTVPEDAIDGPIAITTALGKTDSTFDDNGPLVADFDVNAIARPGLCSLAPTRGAPNDATTLSGTGFGPSRATSTVIFGSAEAGSYSAWSQTSASVTVPVVPDGIYEVSIVVGGIASNAIPFSVETDTLAAPAIVSITPDRGGVGQYITISGAQFGNSTGTVWFEDKLSEVRLLVDTESFPDACSSDYWSDQEITVIVPGGLTLADYDVIVVAGDQESNPVNFTVTDDSPTPGLCRLDPDTGAAGETVVLYGDNFGTAEGKVTFATSVNAVVENWSESEIIASIPAGSVTGAVVVQNADTLESNPVNFEVTTEGIVSVAGGLASYAWSFSSGNIPSAPEIIFECSDDRLSGVPNDVFDNGVGVCVNAAVFMEFTLPMLEPSLRNVTLSECIGGGANPCSDTVLVAGSWTTTSVSLSFDPTGELKTSTVYQVDVPDTVLSVEGVPVANGGSWTFTTRSDGSACRLEKVIVTPGEATITVLNGTQDFRSVPGVACTVLSGPDFSWAWSVDPSYARIDTVIDPTCRGGSTNCALIQGLAEGVTPVVAREVSSDISDDATLTIDFTDPYITNYWPNCTEACVNAEIGADFNTGMSVASLETTGRIQVYLCGNELCTILTPLVGARAECTYNVEGQCTGFRVMGATLTTSKYYRVVVSGDVSSQSGVPLTRVNYGSDFSWTFRVREDGSLCAVDRITLSPDVAIVDRVGAQQAYTTQAFGVADSCSESGQRLSVFDYSWNWTDPIADDDLDNNPSTRVADWSGDVLVDTDPANIPLGCTTSCTAAGSFPQAAVCGDGSLDYGEECEDGNVANGDGCSASCLRESSELVTCGNGTVNRTANGVGEDCDDGNSLDGDGCSAGCLAEGSSSVGATCGNSDVAVISLTSSAGEECDDGNASNGDGCSRECLWEGSPTLAEIGGAVCGDGSVDEPTEQCEDGNIVNGDGCSSQCLWEGSLLTYGSTCGGGGVEYGEACDDGNTTNGDGCSAECLLEGASVEYLTPSFCGDGVVGTGEVAACELGVAGDGNIDPLQVAIVPEGAAFEVDLDTQKAVATIEVEEPASGLFTSATLELMCVAENDSQCPDPNIYGVSDSNCCMLRPTTTLFPTGEDTCRNAAIYAVFTSEMDVDDFVYAASEGAVSVNKYRMYARLDPASTDDGLCPADHTTLALEKRNLIVRLWNSLIKFVRGRGVRADAGDCVVPISTFSQTPLSDGTYKVQMHAAALLAPGADYELVVEGDTSIADDIVSGVRSIFGVGMNGTQTQRFTTGDQICSFDAVQVIDTNADSPYVFTQGEEVHTFAANAISYSTGIPQEIDSIEGAYSWEWTSWEAAADDEIVSVEQVDAVPNTATVIATGENGNDVVMATATIEDNTAAVPTESEIIGSAQITAFLCENPWPGAFADLPWSDTSDGDIGAEVGSGWMNFSTLYCRDAGESGTAGDLPEVVVVRPPITESVSVIKEYLFEVAGSPDAIGIRVASNPKYLSPQAWYESQGFTGEPSSTEVDGYPAIQDGRTVYAIAPNQTDSGELYTNIYVISYNEGASDDTINIYNQILENFKFAVNVADTPACDTGEPACDSSSDKLRRDVQRLIDMTTLQTLLNEYYNENGVYPTLPSGTFVPSISVSVWESWNNILGGALGESSLPVDPLNTFAGCGTEPWAEYSSDNCVNENLGTYVCPTGSHVYQYRVVGGAAAELFGDFEYALGSWVNPVYESGSSLTVVLGSSASYADGFDGSPACGGFVWGTSAVCGDGVIGVSEVCERGQIGGAYSACTTVDALSGYRGQVCSVNCLGYSDDISAVCVPEVCGNGVIDAGEDCDDGSFNGRYGFCGATCSYASAFFCGDGLLAGGEACDCGATLLMSTPDSRAYGAGPGTCGVSLNGTYSSSPNGSCAWDCSGPAAYCGDGTVDSGEVCDGANQTWSGKLCTDSSPLELSNQPCNTDADCSSPLGIGFCGDAGSRADCAFGSTRVMTCDDTPGATCTYDNPDWSTIACTEIGSCGDGTVDPDEACDDGNTDGTDTCTDECKLNVCGDGRVYVGQEQCDEGADNGAGCSSAYGSSCSACSLSCRYEVSSGDYCGDGEINGPEFCDATAIPLSVAGTGACNGGDNNGDVCASSADCDSGSCVFPVCGTTCMSTCPATYASTPLKMITNQPGAKLLDSADLYSYVDSSTSAIPNTATLTIPACTVATGLTASISMDNVDLPTTYVIFVTDLSWTMSLGIGDSDESRLEIAKEAIADAAETLYDEFGDQVQIGAVGYRGLSAGECFNDAEIACTSVVDCGAVGGLCVDTDSSIDDEALLITEPFGYVTEFKGQDEEADLLEDIDSYLHDTATPSEGADGDGQGHGTFTYEALVQAKNMFDEIAASTAGDNARYIAILLSDGEVNINTKRESGDVSPDPITIAQDFDAYIPGTAGYELYAATIGDTPEWTENMEYWSSNGYDGLQASYAKASCVSAGPGGALLLTDCPKDTSDFNGVDYAYNGADKDELETMYEQIVNSITSLVVSVVAKDADGDLVTSIGTVQAGSSITLPWPEGFTCDSDTEQQVPVQINFPGQGQIELSNVRLDYCSP